MQLPIIAHRGQAKPYGSIPRINWAHPLAWGLISYGYDTGSGPIDLVRGHQRVLANTANPPFGGRVSSKYGNGFKAVGGTSTLGICNFTSSTATENFPNTAPYSFACGVMQTANPANGFNVYFGTCVPVSSTLPVGMGGAAAAATDFWFSFGSSVVQTTASGLMVANKFQTLLGVALTSSAAACYVDGVLKLSPAITTTKVSDPGSGPSFYGYRSSAAQGFMIGFVYYGALWKGRALTASEALLLHDDPYCFLIYPEDEMFASLGPPPHFTGYVFNVGQNSNPPNTRMIGY